MPKEKKSNSTATPQVKKRRNSGFLSFFNSSRSRTWSV